MGRRSGKTHNGTRRLHKANLYSAINPNNHYRYWKQDCNPGLQGQCRMNGFDTVPISSTPEYVRLSSTSIRHRIRPYWDMAKQYVLADHFFQTQGSGSFYRAPRPDPRGRVRSTQRRV